MGPAELLEADVIPFDRVPTDADLRSTDQPSTDLREPAGVVAQEVEGLGEGLEGIPATAGARSTSASDSGR